MKYACIAAHRDSFDITVMCAALGHEKARGENGNGLFTAALIRVL